MDVGFYCEQLSKYFDLYVNETYLEVKEELFKVVLIYQGLIDTAIKREKGEL